MKTYLVTYYFVDSNVYAIRYEINKEIFNTKIEFQNWLENQKYVSNMNETINMNNVCRFTIDELESEEQ